MLKISICSRLREGGKAIRRLSTFFLFWYICIWLILYCVCRYCHTKSCDSVNGRISTLFWKFGPLCCCFLWPWRMHCCIPWFVLLCCLLTCIITAECRLQGISSCIFLELFCSHNQLILDNCLELDEIVSPLSLKRLGLASS